MLYDMFILPWNNNTKRTMKYKKIQNVIKVSLNYFDKKYFVVVVAVVVIRAGNYQLIPDCGFLFG